MNNSLQKQSDFQASKHEASSASIEANETNQETNLFVKDRDTILSMFVLLLTCLALAALAHVLV